MKSHLFEKDLCEFYKLYNVKFIYNLIRFVQVNIMDNV